MMSNNTPTSFENIIYKCPYCGATNTGLERDHGTHCHSCENYFAFESAVIVARKLFFYLPKKKTLF